MPRATPRSRRSTSAKQLSVRADQALRRRPDVAIVYGQTERRRVRESLARNAFARTSDLGNRWGTYALFEFDRNTFASIDRRFQEGLGVLYHPDSHGHRYARRRSWDSGSWSSVDQPTRAARSPSAGWRESTGTALRRRRTGKSARDSSRSASTAASSRELRHHARRAAVQESRAQGELRGQLRQRSGAGAPEDRSISDDGRAALLLIGGTRLA